MKDYADVYKTAGAFSWNELMTTDPQAAAEFYGHLFGWKFDTMDMGGDSGPYRVVKVGDVGMGGMMKIPAEAAGMPPAWGSYVTVSNVDETIKQATALGGKVCVPAMDIPKVGRMAVIADPQGAMLNVIQYAAM